MYSNPFLFVYPTFYRSLTPPTVYLVVLDESINRLEQQSLVVSAPAAGRQETTFVLHDRLDRYVSASSNNQFPIAHYRIPGRVSGATVHDVEREVGAQRTNVASLKMDTVTWARLPYSSIPH